MLQWRKTAYSSREIVAILLSTYESEEMCVSQPINVSHNVSFLVDTRSLQHKEDLKCDDMGAWKHNGSPKCWFRVETNSRGKKRINAVDKKSNPMPEDVYELRRAYYKNSSDSNVRKIVSKLYGMYCYIIIGVPHLLFSALRHPLNLWWFLINFAFTCGA